MVEPVRRMERAFFERLALVRSDGDSIRRSMAASSFYAAVEAVRAKKNGGLDFSKPPFIRLGIGKGLLYDGFFSFAVVRQQALIPMVYKAVSRFKRCKAHPKLILPIAV